MKKTYFILIGLSLMFLFSGCTGPVSDTPPPIAVDDNITIAENTSIAYNVINNDSNVAWATVEIVSPATHGVITPLGILDAGEITYTPNANYTGTDSFTYKGGDAASPVTATVYIVIDLDTDGDGIGNPLDADDDNDGVADVNDSFPLDENESIDTDNDGIGNNADMDDDNDSVPDVDDINSTDPHSDTDGDGIDDLAEGSLDSDGDGISDALESNSTDSDSDGVPDQADDDNMNPNNDSDGDGISNANETEQGTDPQDADTDGDGLSDGEEGEIDSDGDGIIDALESNITDADGDGVADQEDANNNDPNVGALVVADACTELTQGVYAYEEWKSYDVSADDAFMGDSQLKEIKINAADIIHLREDAYTSATTFTTNINSAQAGWISTPAENFILDVSTMTREEMGRIGLFPNNKVGCIDNIASFTGYNSLSSYEIHLSALDIGGHFILDHYADLEVEINDDINNKTKTFPAGSELLVGTIVLTSDHYLMEADSDTVVTDALGASMAGINFTTVSSTGQVLVFNSNRTMTLVNDGSFTFVQQDGSNIANGTWQVMGTAPYQYIKTTGSTEDSDSGEVFFAVVAGELRFGEYFPAGWTLHIGTEPDDIMDEVMFNKVAMEGIQSIITAPAPQLLKKTGQTKSYDLDGTQIGNDNVADGTLKDDGYYQKGLTPSYSRDAGTQIVTDNITNLQWQDNADVATVTKPWVTQTNYNAGDYNNTSGDTATTYCTNLTLGGLADWRLPNIVELGSIVDYGVTNPSIDMAFISTVSNYYWSSSAFVGSQDGTWVIRFFDGYQWSFSREDSFYVRCVRAGQ